MVVFDTLMHIYKGMSVKGIPFFLGIRKHSMKKEKRDSLKMPYLSILLLNEFHKKLV